MAPAFNTHVPKPHMYWPRSAVLCCALPCCAVLCCVTSGLDHTWGVELYGELLEIGGGKERMTKYFKVMMIRLDDGQNDEQRL